MRADVAPRPSVPYAGTMSALFPNVPNVPGVPAVLRPTTQLGVMASGTRDSQIAAESALSQLGASMFGPAATSLGQTVTSSDTALGAATSILSDGAFVVGSISNVSADASGALAALQAGDIGGAIRGAERTVESARQAVAAVSALINPPSLPALTTSGDEVNADTARQWGLFTQYGIYAVTADNVMQVEVGLEARISDYPVAATEEGTVGFASYNKVIVPYEVRLVLSRGGSVEDRQDFLKGVQEAWQSVELFNVVTPECVYLDMNVTNVRHMAAADRGATLMTLELTLRKIRQTASLTFTSTKDASGATQTNDGSVQSRPVAEDFRYGEAA